MPCNVTAFAFNARCNTAPGGIKSILVADPSNVVITGWNSSAGTATLTYKNQNAQKPFYRWDVAPGQSTLNTEAQINEANHVRFYGIDLVAVLNGFNATSAGSNILQRLPRVVFIVECNDGTAYLVGFVGGSYGDIMPQNENSDKIMRGADVTAFAWTPGQAKGDALRASITAHIDSFFMPFVVTGYSNLVND